MSTFNTLLDEIERLPATERWRLVKLVLHSLEQEQAASPAADWGQFLRETYGSLHETPLQRWPQRDYDDSGSISCYLR